MELNAAGAKNRSTMASPLPSVLPYGSVLQPRPDPKLPAVYRLPSVHPCRNAAFTRETCPSTDQEGFRDYVAVVERTQPFMQAWEDHRKGLGLPKNGDEGALPSSQLRYFN